MHQDDSGPVPALQDDSGRTPEANAAVSYWQTGLRPVLLTPAGARVFRPGRGMVPSDGKDPIGRGWAFKVYSDEEEIWAAYRAHPGAGVGLALGLAPEGSPHHDRLGDREPCGLVDLEVDDPEAAAPTLAAIFGPGGSPECGWRSARGPHLAFILYESQARRLLGAGIHQAALDGKTRPCLAGLELRLGTLDPAVPRQTQSVAPPTRTRNKDGTISEPRALVAPREWLRPMPERLLRYLIDHLGVPSKVAAQRAQESARAAAAVAAAIPLDRAELDEYEPIDRFEEQLRRLGMEPIRDGDLITARCPFHEGTRKNFEARLAPDGKVLIHCHGRECEPGDVLEALGLELRDLFPDRFRREAPARAGRRRRSSIDAVVIPRGPAQVTAAEADAWAEEHDRYALELFQPRRIRRRAELAERLGLPEAALDGFAFGWREKNPAKDRAGRWVDLGPAWTWPEHDHRGRVVGINRRFVAPAATPKKKLVGTRYDAGRDRPPTHRACRGLVYPLADFAARPGPVHVVEGESDVLALAYCGAAAVGRPGCTAGLDEVARLLAGDPRDVVVVGERDRQPDGPWPGDPEPAARTLAGLLGREVGWVLPPEGCKDIRAAVVARLSAAER